MMSIEETISEIKKQIGDGVTLVAVSKTRSISDILKAYSAGQRDFGENKVQEINEKATGLPADIRWHFIGHLQSNKVKNVVPFVHLIHGVDTLKLLTEINKRAEKVNRVVDCLLQIWIADEESKFGLDEKELTDIISGNALTTLKNVNLRGLMGMATNTDDQEKIRSEFRHLNELYKKVSQKLKKADFNLLSMGMTNDYTIAIEEGSNMVRIGSLIFGERDYL